MVESNKIEKCANCDTLLLEEAAFCHACGQRCAEEKSLGAFVSHFLNDSFTFDSKIIKSVGPLIIKPGVLTLEYLKGRRVSYIPPLRLFIFSSIIFFLLLGLLNQGSLADATDLSAEDQVWDRFFTSWLPKLFFVLFPIFALFLSLLFRKSKKGMLTHFLFSLHFHSTLFLVGSLYIVFSWVFLKLNFLVINQLLLGLFSLFLILNLWLGLKKVYEQSVIKLSIKYLILAILYLVVLALSAVVLALLSL